MAKESMKAREVKRAKLVAKYAAKRAALKEIVNTFFQEIQTFFPGTARMYLYLSQPCSAE